MPELVRKSASATNGGELDSSTTQVIPGAKTFSGAVTISGALTPAGGIVGKTDGVAVPAGYVGEKITFTNLTNSIPANTTVNLASATLTPGVYLVISKANIERNGATLSADAFFGMSLSASSATLNLNNESFVQIDTVGSRTLFRTYYLTVNSTASYFITGRTGATSGTPILSSPNYVQEHLAVRIA